MKFAYGSIKKINEAIEAGTIPAETLIITSDSADVAELFFYDKNKLLKKVERKNKFLTIDEAKAREIALSQVPNGTIIEISFDYEMGVLVYDVTVVEGTTEYDFEISGVDGSIISRSMDSILD